LIFDVTVQIGDEPFESLAGFVVQTRGLQSDGLLGAVGSMVR
jgi:hypothetical protein